MHFEGDFSPNVPYIVYFCTDIFSWLDFQRELGFVKFSQMLLSYPDV